MISLQFMKFQQYKRFVTKNPYKLIISFITCHNIYILLQNKQFRFFLHNLLFILFR